MLGVGYINPKSNNSQRQRIDIFLNNLDINGKETKKKILIQSLINKYFNKICNHVVKEISLNKNKTIFYFNYYDFVNDKLGHPQSIMTQLLYEMCYEYSEFVSKDQHDNIITLKTIFGQNFKFTIKGKNLLILEW